ncbi:hypothetical protein IW245_007519 [Longispora fulva]|uniref:Uncharacterized protein n=1 Tax=Longispora fulva TaxID=619741 RepID=A0A8J7GNX4_9ACTN|nr:hypothetical protein [Longispora fulva]
MGRGARGKVRWTKDRIKKKKSAEKRDAQLRGEARKAAAK